MIATGTSWVGCIWKDDKATGTSCKEGIDKIIQSMLFKKGDVIPERKKLRQGCTTQKSGLGMHQKLPISTKTKVRLGLTYIYCLKCSLPARAWRFTAQGPFINTMRTPTAKDCLGNNVVSQAIRRTVHVSCLFILRTTLVSHIQRRILAY